MPSPGLSLAPLLPSNVTASCWPLFRNVACGELTIVPPVIVSVLVPWWFMKPNRRELTTVGRGRSARSSASVRPRPRLALSEATVAASLSP